MTIHSPLHQDDSQLLPGKVAYLFNFKAVEGFVELFL